MVTAAGCDFNPTSSVTLTERIIQPVELQVNLQLCKYDFVNDWEAQQMGYGLGQTLPPKFADFMIAHVAAEVAQNTEFCIWQGDTAAATNNSFDGFRKTNCSISSSRRHSRSTTSSSNSRWFRMQEILLLNYLK